MFVMRWQRHGGEMMKRVWAGVAIAVLTLSAWWAMGARGTGAAGAASSTAADEAAIRKLLNDQAAEWNRGDLDAFMTGYWNSPDVAFVSGNGVTRGYAGVLARYKKGYPTQVAMGKLLFTDLEVHVDCGDSAYAIGQFRLQLAPNNPTGWFTLNFRKFKEGWKVVVDHTSAAPVPARPVQ
jgi:ketosteroid isomerase-like protein